MKDVWLEGNMLSSHIEKVWHIIHWFPSAVYHQNRNICIGLDWFICILSDDFTVHTTVFLFLWNIADCWRWYLYCCVKICRHLLKNNLSIFKHNNVTNCATQYLTKSISAQCSAVLAVSWVCTRTYPCGQLNALFPFHPKRMILWTYYYSIAYILIQFRNY